MHNPFALMLRQEADTADAERLERVRRAWEAYHGNMPKALKIRPAKPGEPPPPDDNIRVNLTRLVVDKGVSFLFGKPVVWEVDGEGTNPEDEWLAACWEANGGMSRLQRLALNGAVTGHAFIRLKQADPARYGHPYPRVVVLDPSNVRVEWEPDDYELVTRYRIEWKATERGKPILHRQIIERNDAGQWTIADYRSEGQQAGREWYQVGETEVWPWAWCPIFHCQNLPAANEFWGMSDLECDVLDVNRAVNFVLSNTNRILRLHAHPKSWGRGFRADEVQTGPDQMIVINSKDGELKHLEMQGDLTSSMEFYQRLKEVFHEITRTPEVATGKLENLGQLSGVALQILHAPLLEKTETKRENYGPMLGTMGRRLLEMANFGPDHTVKPIWPDVLPKDRKEEAETAEAHHRLGASRTTLLKKVGYKPEEEAEKREAEAAEWGSQALAAFDRGVGMFSLPGFGTGGRSGSAGSNGNNAGAGGGEGQE